MYRPPLILSCTETSRQGGEFLGCEVHADFPLYRTYKSLRFTLFSSCYLSVYLSPPPPPSHTPRRGSSGLQLQNRRLSFMSTRCSKRALPCSTAPTLPPPSPLPQADTAAGDLFWWECSVFVTRCVVIRHTWPGSTWQVAGPPEKPHS